MHCAIEDAPGLTAADEGLQTLKVPVMHQPEVLHWVQAPPLAPSNPGRHTQSVTWVDLRGL